MNVQRNFLAVSSNNHYFIGDTYWVPEIKTSKDHTLVLQITPDNSVILLEVKDRDLNKKTGSVIRVTDNRVMTSLMKSEAVCLTILKLLSSSDYSKLKECMPNRSICGIGEFPAGDLVSSVAVMTLSKEELKSILTIYNDSMKLQLSDRFNYDQQKKERKILSFISSKKKRIV